jgi:hypothetical protein
MKLFVMQLSPPSRQSVPLRSKYSPRHPVLKHPKYKINLFHFAVAGGSLEEDSGLVLGL